MRLPTPEWIFGDAINGHEYIIHTAFPRFTARLADSETAAVGGVELVLGTGDVLCDFEWLDQIDQSDTYYLGALLDSATRALEIYEAHQEEMSERDA